MLIMSHEFHIERINPLRDMGHICPIMIFVIYIVAIALDLIVLHAKQFSIRKGNNIR